MQPYDKIVILLPYLIATCLKLLHNSSQTVLKCLPSAYVLGKQIQWCTNKATKLSISKQHNILAGKSGKYLPHLKCKIGVSRWEHVASKWQSRRPFPEEPKSSRRNVPNHKKSPIWSFEATARQN